MLGHIGYHSIGTSASTSTDMTLRSPAVAGTFYPAEPDALDRVVRACLDARRRIGSPPRRSSRRTRATSIPGRSPGPRSRASRIWPTGSRGWCCSARRIAWHFPAWRCRARPASDPARHGRDRHGGPATSRSQLPRSMLFDAALRRRTRARGRAAVHPDAVSARERRAAPPRRRRARRRWSRCSRNCGAGRRR